MTRGQVGAAIGVATLAPTIFAFTGPNIADARKRAADPDDRRYMRKASIYGAVTVIGLGVAVGLVVDDRDWYTVGAAVLASVGLVALNEWALAHPKGAPAQPATKTILQVAM